MQATAQRLTKDDGARLLRTCARLAISTLLFFRGALPRRCFKVTSLNGVAFPLLDPATDGGRLLTNLIEAGVMAAARGGALRGVDVCLYAPPEDEAEDEAGAAAPAGWELLETYHIDLHAPLTLRKHDVPRYLRQLKADFVTTSLALPPLTRHVGVALRNVHDEAAPTHPAPEGFVYPAAGAPHAAPGSGLQITHADGGCTVGFGSPRLPARADPVAHP